MFWWDDGDGCLCTWSADGTGGVRRVGGGWYLSSCIGLFSHGHERPLSSPNISLLLLLLALRPGVSACKFVDVVADILHPGYYSPIRQSTGAQQCAAFDLLKIKELER